MATSGPSSSILSKTVQLLDALGEAGGPVRYTDLLKRTGLTKGTCHRILAILTNEGLVHFDAGARTYRLGAKVMGWAAKVWRDFDLRDLARDEMLALNREVNENVLLAVGDDTAIVYIDRVDSHRPLRPVASVGTRVSAHLTALGKSMLAALPPDERSALVARMDYTPSTANSIKSAEILTHELLETEARGFAIDNGEHQPEVQCIAAAIRDFQGRPVGAISISSPVHRVSREKLLGWAPLLSRSVAAVSARIGHVGAEISVQGVGPPQE